MLPCCVYAPSLFLSLIVYCKQRFGREKTPSGVPSTSYVPSTHPSHTPPDVPSLMPSTSDVPSIHPSKILPGFVFVGGEICYDSNSVNI